MGGDTGDANKCGVGERCTLNAIYTVPGEPASVEMLSDKAALLVTKTKSSVDSERSFRAQNSLVMSFWTSEETGFFDAT